MYGDIELIVLFGFAVGYFGFVVVVDFGPSMWLCYSIDKELLSIEIINKTPSHVIMSENQAPTLWLSLLIYLCVHFSNGL